MRKLLKFSGIKETDNFETHGLEAIIRDWLQHDVSTPFDASVKIEPFEFKRRDGFIPHSHNKGGLDLYTITAVSYLMGSGEHFGTAIEQWTEDSWDRARKDLLEQAKERGETVDADSDEFYDSVYDYCSDDYETVAWRVRVMYEGNGKLTVFAGYDTDAPYFRFSGPFSSLFEQSITFKTLSGLKRQLERMTKALEASQNEVKQKTKKGA